MEISFPLKLTAAPDTAAYRAFAESCGVLDLSERGRVCLLGADRARFLHGQITNDVKRLAPGQGCYAALTTNKGKLQSDLNVIVLADEILLDFELGLTALVTERLERFLVADDVEIVDVAPHYGLVTLQGPKTADALAAAGFGNELSAESLSSRKIEHADWGDCYVVKHARLGGIGCDVFVPADHLDAARATLISAAESIGGGAGTTTAFEIARVEAGIPRFGADMSEANLAPEAGIESRAIRYNKGCYIGQEVLNRIYTQGQVTRMLRTLQLNGDAGELSPGDTLFLGEKKVGELKSIVFSPRDNRWIALGYVKKGAWDAGTRLETRDEKLPSLPAIVVR